MMPSQQEAQQRGPVQLKMALLTALVIGVCVASFFGGMQFGRGDVAEATPTQEKVKPLLDDAVANGDLQELLARVERPEKIEVGFPDALAQSRPPLDDLGKIPAEGFAIHLRAEPDAVAASALVSTLAQAGHAAYRIQSIEKGVAQWNIRVGGYATAEDAAAAQTIVQQAAGLTTSSVTKAP
jgi:hypothetical protein